MLPWRVTMPHRRVQCSLLTHQLRPGSCTSFWDALPEAQDHKKTNRQQLFSRSLVKVKTNGDGGNWALPICLLLQISSQPVRWGTSQINDFFLVGEGPSNFRLCADCFKLKYTSHGRLRSSVKQNQVNLQQHTGRHRKVSLCVKA